MLDLLNTNYADHQLVRTPTELRKSAEAKLAWVQPLGPLAVGMEHIQVARAWLYESENVCSKTTDDQSSINDLLIAVERSVNSAIELFRRSGEAEFQVIGLLRRATLWRICVAVCSQSEHESRDVMVAYNLREAGSDLSDVQSIASSSDMLIWQIEAALERTRLFLTLHHAGWEGEAPAEPQHGDGTSGSAGASPPRWLDLAREKLDEARQLVEQTEKPYVPHVPDWDEWEPPEYVGVFKAGDIVGYHCRNDEIDRLQNEIDALTAES